MENKVLIVDDEDLLIEPLKEFLELENYVVDTASDGKVALKKIECNKFNIIISDIFMPEKDGYELLKEIRNKNNEVKIILVSGYGASALPAYLSMGDNLGADATIAKPINFDKLKALLQKILN